MTTLSILWPTIALVAVIFTVVLTMAVQRVAHTRRTPPQPADFVSRAAADRYFQPVALPSDNLGNLFEMPVLYFALVPLLVTLHQASRAQVVLAWAYVLLRAVHSYVHIVRRKVRPRFYVFLLSCIVLAAMWIGFAIDLGGAAEALAAVGRT